MNNLTLTARSLHKQRMHELMEEARIERFLTDRKKREAEAWQQRRHQHYRKNH